MNMRDIDLIDYGDYQYNCRLFYLIELQTRTFKNETLFLLFLFLFLMEQEVLRCCVSCLADLDT